MAKFTAGELKVMQLLWEHGEMKPAEIQDLYPEPIKNAAMRSYLTILVEKGHITRRQVGKAYFYKAKTLQHRVFHSMLKELVDTFCGGSKKQLLLSLVKSEKLSEEQLQELKEIAEQAPAKETKESKRKTSGEKE
jgi:BlaI family transcriptional regulator, penicillinase repressor